MSDHGPDDDAEVARTSDDGVVVLLDVDGTLVDSVWLHVIAWASAFRRAGHDVPAHRIHPLVGMGADRLVETLIGQADPDMAAHHTELHLARRDDIRPLPGARDLVRRLHERGARPVLASSASDEELDAVRSILDVDAWVVGHTTSADVEHSKPSPDIFAAALDVAGGDRHRALAIGDAVWDAQAARALSIPFVGVETGGVRPAELAEAGAVAVYADPEHLLAAIEDGLLARLTAPASA